VIQLLRTTDDKSWPGIFDGDPVYFVMCDFSEKDVPKAAGFRWNPLKKLWYTDKPHIASKMVEYAAETMSDWVKELSRMKVRQDAPGPTECPYCSMMGEINHDHN